MGQEAFIKTEKLSVGYDKKIVLDNINIDLNKGEILSLIGPNGAGKTTFIKSIITQLKPLGGTVFMENADVFSLNPNKLAKSMAVVLTNKLQTELMTVRDVVATGRYPYTGKFGILSDEDEKKVSDAINLAGIKELEGCDFTQISDGQKQRVMLSRALAQEPEIIVLDEPTSFLDIKYKIEFLSLLKSLAKEKSLTVIMSLHEVELAGCVSDKVACFKNNKLDKIGFVSEIFAGDYLYELYDINKNNVNKDFSNILAGIFAYNKE